MTAVQLALCDPAWADTLDASRILDRAVARIERQTLAEPANPNYQPKPSRRAYRRIRTIHLANQDYL